MSLKDVLPVPPTYINKYVWDSLKSLDPGLSNYGNIVPFFPISDARADDWPWQTKPYVIYDQLLRFRSGPLYVVRKSQLLYVVKGTPTEVLAWSNAIGVILDRHDAAGQDVNAWLSQNHPSAGVYFHWFRVMQVDQAAENRMDFAVNQKYLSTMVIEYQYHLTKTGKFD
jgi:hypothetical protein